MTHATPTAPSARQILVVEDDVSIREALVEILAEESYSVLSAVHGGEAMALLNRGARPGLVLLDLMMPVMTGWQVLEAMQRDPALRKIPVLVFSATANVIELTGAREILTKPLNLDRLLETIGRHIE